VTPTPSVLRVANCSGFFGDRLSAAEEMVSGGPIDVLTGDWLAELTMYILHKTRERSGGYARTFLRQLEAVLPTCLERGITIVSNAGGLNPEGLAAAVAELARRQGLDVRVASISGDDITHRVPALQDDGWPFVNLDTDEPLPDAQLVTANAYLGARPIADALEAGAQVVVTGRVTDASVIVGPALHAFGWRDGDLDPIAGAVVAGHVIECGAQCCGGNYAFFDEIPDATHIGFPIAELHPDGSSVITKHPGTGGAVTVGTVTAQLLYEIAGPRYLSPDAVARFDTIALEQEGPDRVRIAGVVGEPPPPTLKVTANLEGGWRNSMTLAITGALVEQKARLAADTVWAGIPAGRASFSETSEVLSGDLSGEGMAFLRLAVRGDDETSVGRAFSGAVVETSLASYPGTFFTSAPTPAQAVARYWPTTVAADEITPRVVCDGAAVSNSPRSRHGEPTLRAEPTSAPTAPTPRDPSASVAAELVTVPLWVLVGGRSGDKGGDANVGLWADSDLVAQWLLDTVGVAQFREILPEAAAFEVSRFPLPNLRAVNFVVHGILGWGVASNLRLDSQAKGLAELLRSRPWSVPPELVSTGPPAERLAALNGAGRARFDAEN
jgi:Acyclic terpene utilisation family protein AtuA